ncbi:hypothetical protein LCGC14_1362430 [marine sediment metagenome]|uniref:Uncharacterized protein n=1 Tax=marine sediment metagenome TaxID=412755 RepID=A0A0F9KTS5_9ZZZZ
MKTILISEVALDAIIANTILEMSATLNMERSRKKAGDASIFSGDPHGVTVFHLEGMKQQIIKG